MTIPIVNPFAGCKDIFNFVQHEQAGYAGGDDFAWPLSIPITAAASGRAFKANDGLNGVSIELADGRIITVRENKSYIGTYPRTVHLGDDISYGGLLRSGIIRDPHIDGTENGNRVPFLPWVTGLDPSGVGPVTPVLPPPIPPTEEDDEMNVLGIYRLGDGANKLGGGSTAVYFYVTGPGYWLRTTSADVANYWANRLGNLAAPDVTYADIAALAKASGVAAGSIEIGLA